MPNNFYERRKWFENMIGQKVYRKDSRCIDCEHKPTCTNSILIKDLEHAQFLHDVEVTDMRQVYFDNKILQ